MIERIDLHAYLGSWICLFFQYEAIEIYMLFSKFLQCETKISIHSANSSSWSITTVLHSLGPLACFLTSMPIILPKSNALSFYCLEYFFFGGGHEFLWLIEQFISLKSIQPHQNGSLLWILYALIRTSYRLMRENRCMDHMQFFLCLYF